MPDPSVLTIQQGQETACANITIHDDITIEMVEEFNISLVMENHTFGAGVNLTLDTATVQIMDDDGNKHLATLSVFFSHISIIDRLNVYRDCVDVLYLLFECE